MITPSKIVFHSYVANFELIFSSSLSIMISYLIFPKYLGGGVDEGVMQATIMAIMMNVTLFPADGASSSN